MKKERLGNHIELISGYAFKSKFFNKEKNGLPLIRVRDVNSGFAGIYYDGPFDNRYLIHNGDLLIGMDGDFRSTFWKYGESLLNQRVCKVILKDTLDLKYLNCFLPNALNEIHRKTNYTTVKHLSARKIRDIEIPLPKKRVDQKKIAKVLTDCETLIVKRKKSIQLLDDLLQATFLEMFGDPVVNPKKWEIVELSEFGTIDRGVSKHRPRNAPELLNGNHPLIQTGDVANSGTYIKGYKQTYSDIGLMQSKKWPEGTLCITIAANIAKTGILNFDACFPDSIVGFIVDESEGTNLYIHHLFSFFQRILEKSAPSAAQKNINLGILRSFKVPKPPLDRQLEFDEIVIKVEELRVKYGAHLQELECLYGSLSQKAFKGELDLSKVVLEDEAVDSDPPSEEAEMVIKPASKMEINPKVADSVKKFIDVLDADEDSKPRPDSSEKIILEDDILESSIGLVDFVMDSDVEFDAGLQSVKVRDPYINTDDVPSIEGEDGEIEEEEDEYEDSKPFRINQKFFNIESGKYKVSEEEKEKIKEYKRKANIELYGKGNDLREQEVYKEAKLLPDGRYDITNVNYLDFIGMPIEIQMENYADDESKEADFAYDELFFQFFLKDNFRNQLFTIEDVRQKFNNYFIPKGIDFHYEVTKKYLFIFLEEGNPRLKQIFNEKENTIKLQLTDEAYKAKNK